MEEGFHFHENTTVNTNSVQMQESWENKHFPCLCTCVVEKKSFVLQLRMKSQQFAFLPPHVYVEFQKKLQDYVVLPSHFS